MNDDAQLIAQTLAGRSAAFGELVRKYQDRLYHSVVHLAGSAEDARDVVQEAFVQAFLKLESYRGSAAFYTWLYRITLNAAVTHRRRQRRSCSVDHARQSGNEPVDGGDGPGQRIQRDERCQQVRRALGRLNREHRTILVLREIEGCPYETIAEILDVPVGTVRSRLHRARLQLKEELKGVLTLDD